MDKNPQQQPAKTPTPDVLETSEDQVIKGHTYDGIREYDNPMPAWWVWLFWGTIIFAIIYVLGIHVFNFVDTYEEDLTESLNELEQIRTTFAATAPAFEADAATLLQYINDPAMVEAGATIYTAQCASCHGDQGQGLIGPNMVDEYWIHGGSNVDIYRVITQGVLDKGMPPWEAVLSPQERAQVVAFIRSIYGTTPPNPKEPQGEQVTYDPTAD